MSMRGGEIDLKGLASDSILRLLAISDEKNQENHNDEV